MDMLFETDSESEYSVNLTAVLYET